MSWFFATLLAVAGVVEASAAASPRPPQQPDDAPLGAALAVQRAGCVDCHAAAATAPFRSTRGPSLDGVGGRRAGPSLAGFLARHDRGLALDEITALVGLLRDGADDLQKAAVAADAIDRGAVRYRELACVACHDPSGIDGLAARTDFAHVAAFLRDPAARWLGLAHDFALDAADVEALAAFLLREQRDREDARPGIRYECFELKVDDPGVPALDGLTPAKAGTTDRFGVDMRTRDDHFVLRFDGWLAVPTSGDYEFQCGSDDSSFLWVDDTQVVTNADIAPYRRRRGRVHLDAGAHRLRVIYTEAAGEERLDVQWRPVGGKFEDLDARAVSQQPLGLVPPRFAWRRADADEVARGRAVFAARRCGACHEHDGVAAATAATPFARLPERACAIAGEAAIAIVQAARSLPPADESLRLRVAFEQDGCARCHARDGRGGVVAERRELLPQREDLGDEARLPPDLTAVGRRLRADWLDAVLREGRAARPYLKARTPKLPADRAAFYARAFEVVDAPADGTASVGDADANGQGADPAHLAEVVERGRQLVGAGGRNCVTCHSFDGRASLGPQGMDLALQSQRLRPEWFRRWLLEPTVLRPGTRMPALFPGGDRERDDVDAVLAWARLGRAAPVPRGMRSGGALVLDPVDRPILHGAFLDGLSARCLAVGSPLRVHWAWDLEHCRLAWIWRGAFLDAVGTWEGRAGKLLRPLGSDWRVLDDVAIEDREGVKTRRLLGRRTEASGYPVLRFAVGDAEMEDEVLPRLEPGGAVIVRRLRCVRGEVRIGARTLRAGEVEEVVHRW